MPKTRQNTRLDRAITDLNAVNSIIGERDDFYGAVDEALSALKNATDPYYKGRSLTREAISEILDGYKRLLKACNDYIRENEGKNLSGTQVGRVECLKAMKGILTEDMVSLNESLMMENPGSLITIISEGRSIEATIEDQSTIHTEGGQMSSRIPIRLKSEDGRVEEGLFTEKSDLIGYLDVIKSYSEEYKTQFGEASYIGKMADIVFSTELKPMRQLSMKLEKRLDNAKNREEIARSGFAAYELIKDILEEKIDEDLKAKFLAEGPEADKLRKETLDMVKKAKDYCGSYVMNHYYAGIPKGENIDKRNVAMSTIANYFDRGNLVAPARSFTVKIGDREVHGTFQKKAVGGDINRLTQDSELCGLGKYKQGDYSSVNSAELKRQIADLQVIDFICGNCDRHRGNMIYKTEIKDGKTVVTGITGIDNDMSFGTKNEANNSKDEKIVNPKEMKIMRETTAKKVLDLTPEKLDFLLKDMNFTKVEMDNCKKRLEMLQNQLKEDMALQELKYVKKLTKDMILVVPDEKFKDYDIRELAKVAADRQNTSYFTRIKNLVNTVKTKMEKNEYAKPEKKLVFSDARAVKGKLNFRDEAVRTNINLALTEQRIIQAKQAFDSIGNKWYGKDTGNYQWLKQSVNSLESYFREVKNNNQGKAVVEIPESEAVKVEALFRQIRKAGDNYINTHKANPRTISGRMRLNAAKEMQEFEAAYADSGVRKAPDRSIKINHTNLDNLLDEYNKEKNITGKTKELNKSTIVRRSGSFKLTADTIKEKRTKTL